jgi:hypothetical protein
MASSSTLNIHAAHPNSCSICGHAHLVHAGDKDFGVSGCDHFEGRRIFADYGVPIPYYECRQCGFIFTNAFDHWTTEQWRAHVYNDDYLLADPPFLSERPARNAQIIAGLFHRELPEISILDVGGGNGKMTNELRKCGADIQSHDPIYGNGTMPGDRRFDLITSFEVIEHVPHHRHDEWMRSVVGLLHRTPFARFLLSTEVLQPHLSINWWYICPRNGHISIHSPRSLEILAARVGMDIVSINPSMHLLTWQKQQESAQMVA